MTENEKARTWRLRLDITPTDLGAAIGYSREAIYWFERGCTPPGRTKTAKRSKHGPIDPVVWLRYKMACAGYASQLRGKRFDW